MRDIVLVGAGEYYRQIIGPSLKKLVDEGLARVLCVVDIKDNFDSSIFDSPVEYRKRAAGERLSFLLSDLKSLNPMVILGHGNESHISDAKDMVEAGFTVALEKPYCINKSDLVSLKRLLDEYPSRIVLLEYYLQMKSAPLLILAGKIKSDSFYCTTSDILKIERELAAVAETIDGAFGKMKQLIGDAVKVDIELLEGEGRVGRLDHRGAHLSSIKSGGGMVLDLGIHAIVASFALEDQLGKIDTSFSHGIVRVARCNEHVEAAVNILKLDEEDIAETYAEMQFITSKNIPVRVAVGKYILPNQNRRHITIYGEKGKLVMDLSDCFVEWEDQDGARKKLFSIPKQPDSKYYPVLRAALELIAGNSLFNFSPNNAALGAQTLMLNIRDRAYTDQSIPMTFNAGADPKSIFS